ncbi:hypothetical protein BGZ94_010165 [Podila epigama]|nr:hypothetical protein BGZ94_010165 [Podila epigama]
MTVPENMRPFAKVLLIPELVHTIVKSLAPRERHHARRISKAFHRAFEPYISLKLAHTLSRNLNDPEKLSIPLEQVPSCGQLVRKFSTKHRGDLSVKHKARAQAVLQTILSHCANVQELSVEWEFVVESILETILVGFTSILVEFTSLTSLSITLAFSMPQTEPILKTLAKSNLRHLRSLTLSSSAYLCRIGKWSLVEDVLDGCPSLNDLALVRWPCSRLDLLAKHSLPNWYFTTNEVAEFKSYPQLKALRLSLITLNGKGLIFLTHCFPMLQSLEIDRCYTPWSEPVFRPNYPKPEDMFPTNPSDPYTSEVGPGARFLKLNHLRRLKVSEYDGYSLPWRHSLGKMIKQMPRLSSLDIDHIPSNIPTFREMVLHCSKPEVDQSFKRLWLKLDMKGRHNHWEVQALLRQPCFRNLKELWVEKERILADIKTTFRFPFSLTLTTLRLGLPLMRFDDLTVSNLNRVVFPNLPNLEVLILDCRLHGYDLFRGLGYCPADEQSLPKVAYCGTFGVYPDETSWPLPDVTTASPDVNGVPPGEVTVVPDAVPEVIEEFPEVIVGFPYTVEGSSEVVSVLADEPEASTEEAAVMSENVEAFASVVTTTSENGMTPMIEATAMSEDSVVALVEAVSQCDMVETASDTTTEGASSFTEDSAAEYPAIVQLVTSLDGGLSLGAPLTEDTTDKDYEEMLPKVIQNKEANITQCRDWKHGALRHLRELEVTFTSSYIVHMSDIDSQIIQRFASLECLTIKSKKVHGEAKDA